MLRLLEFQSGFVWALIMTIDFFHLLVHNVYFLTLFTQEDIFLETANLTQ